MTSPLSKSNRFDCLAEPVRRWIWDKNGERSEIFSNRPLPRLVTSMTRIRNLAKFVEL